MKYAQPWLLGAALSLATTLVCPGYAQAEPTPSPQEALAFQEQGRKELAAKHYEQAAAFFEKAHAVLHNPVTALDLMMAYGYLEKNVEASAIGEETRGRAVPPAEPKEFVLARRQIDIAMAALSTRISFLVLHFDPPQPSGVQVTIDGKLLPNEELSKPYRANLGKHVIGCHAPGYHEEQATEVIQDKTSRNYPISISMRPLPDSPSVLLLPSPASLPLMPSVKQQPAGPEQAVPVPWILFGSSAVVAAGLGISGVVVYNSMEGAWTSRVCGPACLEFNKLRPVLTALSISSVAVGAISLGTLGFALYKTFQKPEKNTTAYFVPAPNGGSLVVRW